MSALSDPLTGLAMKEQFETDFAAAANGDKNGGPASVAFLDIDSFMLVNKNHGHEEGDRVIVRIIDVVKKAVSDGSSAVYRVGGDEFAVVLQQSEKESAFLRLESARGQVAEDDELAGIEPRPTISIGLATYPDDGATRQEIIRKADDALFRAKSSGRNRVVLAREEKKVPKTSHFTQGQLDRLAALSKKEGVGEAELLREGLDDLLKKYSS